MIQASAQVTWDAESAEDAIATVNSWGLHGGAQVMLLVEQPERAITQMVVGYVSITPAVADEDGSVTITPDPVEPIDEPGEIGLAPGEPVELPPDSAQPIPIDP
jgi:hypothetical protein